MSEDKQTDGVEKSTAVAGQNERLVMWENLKHATDKDGHPITQSTFDAIEKALRDIVEQYESMPDDRMGKGLTNGHYIRGREALNALDGIDT